MFLLLPADCLKFYKPSENITCKELNQKNNVIANNCDKFISQKTTGLNGNVNHKKTSGQIKTIQFSENLNNYEFKTDLIIKPSLNMLKSSQCQHGSINVTERNMSPKGTTILHLTTSLFNNSTFEDIDCPFPF